MRGVAPFCQRQLLQASHLVVFSKRTFRAIVGASRAPVAVVLWPLPWGSVQETLFQVLVFARLEQGDGGFFLEIG